LEAVINLNGAGEATGAGTLVRYGEDSNDCGALKLQFDAGRGTNKRTGIAGPISRHQMPK
jgi:hypothetical protein